MRYLVDGNNFIGHQAGLSLGDPGSRDQLVQGLCAVWRRVRKPITVVFDGRAPAARPAAVSLGGVRVLYSGAGRGAASADDRILRLLEAAGRAEEVVVVTSDRALGNRARARGAQVLPCHRFRVLLAEAAGADAAGSEKPAHVDVQDWWRWFGLPDSRREG